MKVPFLPVHLVPINVEPRIMVDTATAALHLNRRPQTLRAWACHETGPIQPIRIAGRLAWPVADIRRLLISIDSANERDEQRRA